MNATAELAKLNRETAKNTPTAELIETRKNRKEQMEKMQNNGWWDAASNYHEAAIAPLNAELLKRGVW